MKRILLVVTLACLVAGGWLWSRTSQPLEKISERARAVEFPGFPLDRTVAITFDAFSDETGVTDAAVSFQPASYWNGYSQQSSGRRERYDQWRDWLLFSVMASSTLSSDDVNEAMFDVLPRRLGLFQNLGGFEYGVTRARVVGAGEVVALVPRSAPAERLRRLAHVADEQRKNLGAIPAWIHVFEYDVDEGAAVARVVRRAPLPGSRLFDAAAGYHEATVTTLEDFKRFMASVDDLSYASVAGGGLKLGGRRVPGYRGIRVEDVAAIWQSEQEPGRERSGSGFSLDPQLDKAAIARQADGLVQRLNQAAGIAAFTLYNADAVRADLGRGEVGEYLDAAAQVCGRAAEPRRCNAATRELLLDKRFRFQKARYDGSLKGTEVGMVLFYTDLLMKMWGHDRDGFAPRESQVADFPIKPRMRVAKVFADELDQIPETRLWLGSLDSGFQIASDRQEMLWAPRATRVFAVPHDSLENEDVRTATEPHIYNRVFVTWWNQHYEEVAEYEQEYQRLNEIMKWSQLIGWLNVGQRQSTLGFLAAVPVTRSHWFPEWVQRHPELTFKEWSSIGFAQRGAHDVDTETLPILESRSFDHFGQTMFASGGVSLARRGAIAERSALDLNVSPLARRGNIDYAQSALGRLRTLEKVEYEFARAASGRVSTLARPDASARLRSLVGEFKHTHIDRTIARGPDHTVVSMRTAQARFGELRIRSTPEGMRVNWTSRDVDAAQALARRVSGAPNRAAAISGDASVEAAIPLDASEFLVKVRGADGWVKLNVSSSDDSVLQAGTHARISGPGRADRPINLTWLDDAQVESQLSRRGFLEIPRQISPDGGLSLRLAARPPPAARSVEVTYQGRKLALQVDEASQATFVRWGDLPEDLRLSPGRVPQLVQRDAPALRGGNAAIVREWEAVDYGRLADRISRDPLAVRRAVNGDLQQRLALYDDLLARQRFDEAQRQLQSLHAVHGERPEVVTRLALDDLSRGRVEPAARVANNLESGAARSRQLFLDEIDQRLRVSSGLEQQNLSQLRDYAAWAQEQSAGQTGGRLAITPDGRRLVLEYRADRLQYRAATAADLDRVSRAAVYIEDTPGLNNIDFSTQAGRQALESGILSGRLSFQQLSLGELARYRPQVVRAAGGSPLRLRSVTTAGRSLGRPSGNGSCPANEPARPGCETVYVVREAATASPSM